MESKQRAAEWKEHVEQAEKHPAGIKSYCRERGLTNSNFHYWKNKLVKREKKPPAFAGVQILPRKESSLPDPRWLAEFLKALGSAR